MDILSATTQARPQYGVIIYPESGKFLPVTAHTELEIGFGNGEFTVKYAHANPNIFLYGLEISQACVLRCARRAAGLNNLQKLSDGTPLGGHSRAEDDFADLDDEDDFLD